MNAFIVQFDGDSVVTPSGTRLPKSTFVSRMGRLGFDTAFTAQVCRQVTQTWALTLTPSQAAFINRRPKAHAKGF